MGQVSGTAESHRPGNGAGVTPGPATGAAALSDPKDGFRDLVDGAFRGHAVVEGTRCTYCNPAFARLFGFARAEELLAFTPLLDLVAPVDRERMEGEARRFLATGSPVPVHHRFRAHRLDGTPIWVDLDARSILWEGRPALHLVCQDITEQKKIEESRDLLASATEQAQEAIYMTDVAGTIVYANPTLERLTGYSIGELIGANPRLFKSGKHDGTFYAGFWKTLLEGRMWSGRVVNRRKDGQLIEMDARVSPVRDLDGSISHFVAAQVDSTKTTLLEARLRQAEKMETLGQLAGGVAHDFNNLLQVISGWTLMLMEDRNVDPGHHAHLERIDEAVKRAAGLTRQLLAMSRKSIPQPRAVDLNALVEGQVKLLARLIGENIDLQMNAGAGLSPIHADPGMVEQVVMNLSINARDAMPSGGRLMLETRGARLDEEFCRTHEWASPGDYVRLSVSDTGTGMTREVQQSIFEPFFTTKEAGRGTGLGLATVMNILERHQGLINVYSEPGIGSTFNVYFPVDGSGCQAAASGQDEAVRPGRGERILMVEDDIDVGDVVRESLQRGGYRVDHATDGQQAVDLILRGTSEFDLVILDMALPKLSGRQVYDLVLKLRPDTRFLFSSGYSPLMVDVEFILKRNLPLIQKPYAPRTLLGAVGRILDSRPAPEKQS